MTELNDRRESTTSDMEIALMLAGHIDNPCFTLVDEREEDIRDFYLREAEGFLSTFTNPYARRFLRLKIDEYKITAS